VIDNRDPTTLGENLLAFRRKHKDLTLSQVFDLAKEAEGITLGIPRSQSDSDRPRSDDGLLSGYDYNGKASLHGIPTDGRG
jgi:hypothetical protein